MGIPHSWKLQKLLLWKRLLKLLLLLVVWRKEGRRRRWRRHGLLRQNLRTSSVLGEQLQALPRKHDDKSVVILQEGEVLLFRELMDFLH